MIYSAETCGGIKERTRRGFIDYDFFRIRHTLIAAKGAACADILPLHRINPPISAVCGRTSTSVIAALPDAQIS